MKLYKINALIIALLTAPLMAFARAMTPQGVDAINTQGTSDDITRIAEGALTEHLLLTFGTLPNTHVRVCTAATRPIGFAYDDAPNGVNVGVELLLTGGTRLGIASKAIPAGVRVFATAGGKLTDVPVIGSFLVGEALRSASVDGDEIEIMPLSPVVTP